MPKKKKLHLIDMNDRGNFGFTNATDATRFANLLAKAIPVEWDYVDGEAYHHIQTRESRQISFTIKLNKLIELEKRPKVEVLPPEEKQLGLPAPRKGLPAPLKGLPAPNQS